MNINLICVMLVTQTCQNPDIRKNDIKKIKLLVRRDTGVLPGVIANASDDIKQQIKKHLYKISGTELFHLEQVYTLGDKKYLKNATVDIIHLGVGNIENFSKISRDYELLEVTIQNNCIGIGNRQYKFKTVEKIGTNIEYIHTTSATKIDTDKMLVEILTAWKYLRSRLDNTDIIFKFLPVEFSLEDVHQIYEIISEHRVDKSNFRKKIAKYCTEIPNRVSHRGHRPGKYYKFNVKPGDSWL